MLAYPFIIVGQNAIDEAIAAGIQLSIIWYIWMTIRTQYWWVAFHWIRCVEEHRLVRVQAIRWVVAVHRLICLRTGWHDFVGHFLGFRSDRLWNFWSGLIWKFFHFELVSLIGTYSRHVWTSSVCSTHPQSVSIRIKLKSFFGKLSSGTSPAQSTCLLRISICWINQDQKPIARKEILVAKLFKLNFKSTQGTLVFVENPKHLVRSKKNWKWREATLSSEERKSNSKGLQKWKRDNYDWKTISNCQRSNRVNNDDHNWKFSNRTNGFFFNYYILSVGFTVNYFKVRSITVGQHLKAAISGEFGPVSQWSVCLNALGMVWRQFKRILHLMQSEWNRMSRTERHVAHRAAFTNCFKTFKINKNSPGALLMNFVVFKLTSLYTLTAAITHLSWSVPRVSVCLSAKVVSSVGHLAWLAASPRATHSAASSNVSTNWSPCSCVKARNRNSINCHRTQRVRSCVWLRKARRLYSSVY